MADGRFYGEMLGRGLEAAMTLIKVLAVVAVLGVGSCTAAVGYIVWDAVTPDAPSVP